MRKALSADRLKVNEMGFPHKMYRVSACEIASSLNIFPEKPYGAPFFCAAFYFAGFFDLNRCADDAKSVFPGNARMRYIVDDPAGNAGRPDL